MKKINIDYVHLVQKNVSLFFPLLSQVESFFAQCISDLISIAAVIA